MAPAWLSNEESANPVGADAQELDAANPPELAHEYAEVLSKL